MRRNPDPTDFSAPQQDPEPINFVESVLESARLVFKPSRRYHRRSLLRQYIEALAISSYSGAMLALEALYLYDLFTWAFQYRLANRLRSLFPEYHLEFIKTSAYFHFHYDALETTILIAIQRLARQMRARLPRVGVAAESDRLRVWDALMRGPDAEKWLYLYGEMLEHISADFEPLGLRTTAEDLDVLIRVYLADLYDALRRRANAKQRQKGA